MEFLLCGRTATSRCLAGSPTKSLNRPLIARQNGSKYRRCARHRARGPRNEAIQIQALIRATCIRRPALASSVQFPYDDSSTSLAPRLKVGAVMSSRALEWRFQYIPVLAHANGQSWLTHMAVRPRDSRPCEKSAATRSAQMEGPEAWADITIECRLCSAETPRQRPGV